MNFKYKLVAFGALIAMSVMSFMTIAQAQEFSESHLAAAKRAMTASRSTGRLDTILPKMAEEAKAELIRNRPDQEAQLTEVVDSVAISIAGRRGDLEDEVAQIFAKVFTEDDLKVIAEFYESEAGQKFLRESPIVIREMTQASRVWSNGLQRDMATAISEKLKEAGLQ
ncbi:MAG: DUF2059 domain-containing protein [Salaquimonas sp.]